MGLGLWVALLRPPLIMRGSAAHRSVVLDAARTSKHAVLYAFDPVATRPPPPSEASHHGRKITRCLQVARTIVPGAALPRRARMQPPCISQHADFIHVCPLNPNYPCTHMGSPAASALAMQQTIVFHMNGNRCTHVGLHIDSCTTVLYTPEMSSVRARPCRGGPLWVPDPGKRWLVCLWGERKEVQCT